MPVWKVLLVLVFACICLALVVATLLVPLTMDTDQHSWQWFGGLLFASIFMGTLFTLFLRREDRIFKPGR